MEINKNNYKTFDVVSYHKVGHAYSPWWTTLDTFEKNLQSFSDKKNIILTFDDGYEAIHEDVLPLLQKYKMCNNAIVFIITDLVGKINSFDELYIGEPVSKLLSWDQIKDLHSQGIIIGSHTCSHRILTEINSYNDIRNETIESKLIISKNISAECKYFSYPHNTYDANSIEYIKEAGYEAAFCGISTFNSIYDIGRKCFDNWESECKQKKK